MEFETKIKVDPTKIEKVFTASQVLQAVRNASLKTMETPEIVEAGTRSPGLILMVLAIGTLMGAGVAKELGIDGPEGGYEKGEAGR